MADEAEDVLELEDELEPVTEPDEGETDPDDEVDEPDLDDDEPEGEAFIGFEGEEAAPASEGDNSVIREMRQKIREKDKQIAELQRASQPAKVEVGPEPQIDDEDVDYDTDKFKAKWDAWNGRRQAAAAQEAEAAKANEAQKVEWETRAKAYEGSKTELGVADFEEAEAEVFSTLPGETQALILMTDKPAELVYALSRTPAKLEELSKLNLAQAALQIGELKGKLKVSTRRKKPNPDKPVTGRTTVGGDKELKRLEREAEKTGDRTALIRYRKQQRQA